MKGNYNLPVGWKWVKLGELCHTTSGGTPSRKEPDYYNGKIPWVKSGELDKGLIIDTEEKISEEAIRTSSAKIFPKGTLLIALYGATIGKLAFLGIDAATNQAICGIYKSEYIDSRFLFNYLLHKKQTLVDQGIGGAQPNISQTILKNLDLPLPPKPIQQAIVSKIEELFSELDKGIENLRTAQQQLKSYRQAVLKWAFDGKLTNNKNCEFHYLHDELDLNIAAEPKVEYVTSKNQNVLGIANQGSDKNELPKGWKLLTLSAIATKITDGEHFRPQTQASGIPFLSAKDVREEGVSFDNVLFISETTAKKAMQRCNPERGDILIVSRGATVGRMCIVETDKIFCLLGSVILIKVNESINSRYINYVLKSPLANQKIIGVSGATAQQAIYLRDIKNVEIPFCSIEEQNSIVQAIESRLNVADKLEETIAQSLLQAEALRQSILKKAFKGKLLIEKTEVQKRAIAMEETIAQTLQQAEVLR